MLDYFRWICMLPHIVGRDIYFPMILTRNDLIHEFSCSQHPRQTVISARATCSSPAYHRTDFIQDGNPKANGIVDNWREDLLLLLQISFKAIFHDSQLMVVSHKGAYLDIIFISS